MTRFQRLAAATVAAAFLLVVIGVVVRATDSGLACPNWPGCFPGQFLPGLDADGHVWIEWLHRTVAAVIGFLILGLAAIAWLDHRDRRSILWSSFGAVLLVGFQAWLGGRTVQLGNTGASVTAHLAAAMALVGLLVYLLVRSAYPARLRGAGDQRFTLLAAFAAAAVFGVLLFGSMAAWVLARRASRTMTVVYAVAISGILLPPAVVTVVLLLRKLSLAGTPGGLIGVYMGMYMSTVVFFVTGFIRTVPIELEEAARIDGAGPIAVFARIILPLLRPVLASATILICLYTWNDVFYAFFVLGGGRTHTLPLNLFQVASQNLYLNSWNLVFAYVILMSLPLLAVFTVAQRKIIAGITSGAVK